MKYVFVVLLLSIQCLSMTINGREEFMSKADLMNFDFDVDLDFFRTKEISKALNSMADQGWRLLGYESNSYVEAKQTLSVSNCMEFLISILLVKKFPYGTNANDGLRELLNEIEENWLGKNFKTFKQQVIDVGSSRSFLKIHELMQSLSGKELLLLKNDVSKLFESQLKIERDPHADCLLAMLHALDQN